ncbi:MAG: exodeoxyribonuclease V subunit beta [Myxococcota bacterium]|nr:exodeoxyribonuclease V subunit beta [Myxococcota bacterium]
MTGQPLDIGTVALRGTHLIEASAGTGKTYNVVSLYLRMLADPLLAATVENLLVVTFTEAATAELKHRLRHRLSEVVLQLESKSADDELAASLMARGPAEALRARKRLEQALRSFDQAEIYTIHGLCRRLLEQHGSLAFVPAGAQILADTGELFEEIVRRFLAQEVYSAPSWFARVVRDLVVPEELVGFVDATLLLAQLDRILEHPVLFPQSAPRGDDRYASILSCHEALRATWNEQRETVVELLYRASGFNKRNYGNGKLESLLAWLDTYLDQGEPVSTADEGKLGLLASGSFRMNKGFEEPRHELLSQIAGLRESLAGFAMTQKRHFLRRLSAFAQKEVEACKRRDGVMTFDDLVLRLAQALKGEQGEALAQALRQRYRAALVDEFQDTDAQQYDIFRRVFASAGLPLFLIGDPKQSIYGFRGADVYAYLEARGEAAQTHTLQTNRRSRPALVRAINAIFTRSDKPFGNSGISFEPALPSFVKASRDEDEAALEIVYLSRKTFGGASGKLSQSEALRIAVEMTAEQIARRGFVGCDRTVAVLVRRNRDVEKVMAALRARKIAAAGVAEGNVLAADEAADLCTVFAALLDLADQRKLRAALLTPLLGYTAHRLVEMDRGESDWQRIGHQLTQALTHWECGGALSALRCILEQTEENKSRAERLLEREDGLRQLVNYEHVAELMSLAARETGAPLSAQWRWLFARLGGQEKDKDHGLRLCADATAVRVMTVHKSKGLEFDEVYCPGLWLTTTGKMKEKVVVFHDLSFGGRRCGWILPDEGNPAAARAQLEQFEEELRLAYVALTRAKRRCVVFDGAFDASLRAMTWLLHADPGASDPISAMQDAAARDDDAFIEDLQLLAERSAEGWTGQKVIAIRVPEEEPKCVTICDAMAQQTSLEAPHLVLRETKPVVAQRALVLSFTSLCATHGEASESVEQDELATARVYPAPMSGPPRLEARLLDFERGSTAGDMLHKVLEGLPFGRLELSDLEGRAAEGLAAYGFDVDKWRVPITQGLWEVLHAPLVCDVPGLTLSALRPGYVAAELDFLLPVDEEKQGAKDSWTARLRSVFAEHGGAQSSYAEHMSKLSHHSLRGYLRGFIDLVFEHDGLYYLLDYKSTYLGDDEEAYAPASLSRAMYHNHYVLQYHLYSLALDRYLSSRVPDFCWERCFGGALTLFLRGMSGRFAPFSGVFRDRPSRQMLDALAVALGVAKNRGEP